MCLTNSRRRDEMRREDGLCIARGSDRNAPVCRCVWDKNGKVVLGRMYLEGKIIVR